MRITCSCIADFLANLEGEKVYLNTIHVDYSQRPLNREKISHEIVIQASAVLDKAGGGQALLEAGEICGIDRPREPEGTTTRDKLKAEIQMFCDARGLKIKPGLLGI